MTVVNNHLITDGGTYINWGRTTTQNSTTNTDMSNSTATSDGYLQSGSFWYYPPSGGVTVGAGTNETSICNGITDPNLATPKEDCKKRHDLRGRA